MAPSFPLSVTLGALVGLGLFSLKEFRKYPARKSPLSPSSSPPETSSPGNKVILRSSDGETFVIDEAVASKMAIIKVMLEDGISLEKAILLPNVTGKILAKVIEYCKEHVKDPKFINPILEDELMEFDKKFIKVDERTLHDLILAANYLNVRGLLKLTCQTVADMIKGKTPEEIRKKFNIKYDFSPEEAEEVRKENIWKFDVMQARDIKLVKVYNNL